MKKLAKYLLSIIGLTTVLLFCMSASAGMGTQLSGVDPFFSEPISMVFLGIVMIGAGRFIKSKKY